MKTFHSIHLSQYVTCKGVGNGVRLGVLMGVFLQDIIGVMESNMGQLHRALTTSLSLWSGSKADSEKQHY